MTSTHTFRGRSMQEAVGKLKATLGTDAVIISTRRGADQGRRFVEITATVEEREEAASAPPAMGGVQGASAAYARTAGMGRPRKSVNGPFAERAAWLAQQMAARRVEEAPAPTPTPAPAPAPPPQRTEDETASIRRELAALRQAVNALARADGTVTPPPAEIDATEPAEAPLTETALNAALEEVRVRLDELRGLVDGAAGSAPPAPVAPVEPEALATLRAQLEDVGLSRAHADEVARAACEAAPDRTADDGDLLARLGCALAERMPCEGDLLDQMGDTPRVLAFVGPTGVGKTTTIAKVAAHAQLLRGIPTALVTVDTFRMAAVEQIARYASILECPLRVVKTPEELPAVLEELKAEARLVLVDTTGRSPRAADQVNALARFFPAGWGGELVLTVGANTRRRDLFATVDAFAPLGCARLCVTKLDETDAVGVAYSVARRADRPLAWTTHGQQVPEDIEVAEPAALAARIVTAAAQRSVDVDAVDAPPRRAVR